MGTIKINGYEVAVKPESKLAEWLRQKSTTELAHIDRGDGLTPSTKCNTAGDHRLGGVEIAQALIEESQLVTGSEAAALVAGNFTAAKQIHQYADEARKAIAHEQYWADTYSQVAADPKTPSAETWYNIGQAFAIMRYCDPLAAFRKAKAFGSKAPDLDFEIGRALNSNKEYGAAEEVLRQVIAREPRNAAARAELAEALYRQDRLREAEQENRLAIQLGANDSNSWYMHGIILNKVGGREKATEAAFRTAIALSSDDVSSRMQLCELLAFQEGREVEAEAELRWVLVFEPDRAEAHDLLATVFSRVGRLAEAAAEYEWLIAAKSEFPETRLDLARTYASLGRWADAEAQDRAALKENASSRIYYHLAVVLDAQGKKDEATVMRQKAEAVETTNQ